MAYTATLANQRGLLSDLEHKRLLTLFSRAGLSIDHPLFNDEVLAKGTEAILKTRDGKLRLAVPNPLGSCSFINEYTVEELSQALHKHKTVCKTFAREGAGLEAYVDSSDTGYTDSATEDSSVEQAAREAGLISKSEHLTGMNGNKTNGSSRINASADTSVLEKGKVIFDGLLNGRGVKAQA